MKIDFFEEQKKSFPFKRCDLIVYISVLILLIVLFSAIILIGKSSVSSGFKVVVDGNEVLSYDYESEVNINSVFSDFVEVNENQESIIIKIYTDGDKAEYNTLQADKKNKSVKVIDANCSSSKDCTKFAPVTGGKGTIICLPHKLYVVPLSGGYLSPVVGG